MKKLVILACVLAVAGTGCRTLKKERIVEVPKTVNEQQVVEKNAKIAYDEGDYTEAISLLRALLKKDPKNPVYWGQLGSAYAQLNEYAYAIYAYKNSIKNDPKNVKAMYNLSVVYGEKGDTKEAKEVLKKALKLDPKNPLLQASLGNVMIDEEDYDRAKVLYERIVDVKPDFDIGHFNLGVINYQERDLDGAQKNYEDVLAIKPDDNSAKENLAAIHIMNGNFEVAVKYLKDVIDANPDDDVILENAYFNLGVAYLRQKKYPGALDAFEQAISIEPWDMAAYVNAAILAEELGQKDKAIKYWQKYNRLLPTNKRKKEMDKHLKKMGAETLPLPEVTPEPQGQEEPTPGMVEEKPEAAGGKSK
ncbi:MAG: tetratricopeptide repeat protein [Spirochaetia bacterium]|nr:tetratricopeptide repeat protein [Spirochaetia bacterium]